MTPEELYLFDLRGYLVVEQALTGSEVATLNALIDEHEESGQSEGHQEFWGFLQWGQPFRDLLDHPRLLPFLSQMIGNDFRLDHTYGFNKKKGLDRGLGLHGGGTPYDPSQYYHYRDGRMYNGLTVVVWALSDTPAGQGGFVCIPGSHKSNLPCPPEIAHFQNNPSSCVTHIPVKAGDVLIFTEALAHGTAPWQNDHARRALFYKYSPSHLAWGKNPVIEPENLQDYTERQRRLFEPPYVWHRPPIVDPTEK